MNATKEALIKSLPISFSSQNANKSGVSFPKLTLNQRLPNLRRWYRWHAWLGLATGLFLLVLSLSGAVIVWRSELDVWLNPHLHRVTPGPARVPLEQVAAAAFATLPGYDLFSLRPNEGEGRAIIAFLRRRDGPFDTIKAEVFIHPHTGAVLGHRLAPDAFTGWIYKLHLSLFLGTPGGLFVGLLGVTLAGSCLTGMCIYRRFLTGWLVSPIRWRRGARVFFADVHKSVGLAALGFNLVIAISGAWFNLPKLRELAAPQVSATGAPPERVQVGVPLAELWRRGQRALPDLEPRSLLFPTKAGEPFRVRGGLRGWPLLGTSSSHVLLDGQTGRVAGVRDARSLRVMEKLELMLRPLHFGNFGGWPLKLLWCVLGLTPALLALTGGALWLRRTGRWRRGAAAVPAPVGRDRLEQVSPALLVGLGLTACVCLNTCLLPRLVEPTNTPATPQFAMPAGLMTEGRSVLADWCFQKAYAYFHSAAAMEDYAPPGGAVGADGSQPEFPPSSELQTATEPCEPADWIARFAWHFRPHQHTHLNQGGSDRTAGNLTAEMFPWLWLAIQVDERHIPSYLEAALWLRRAYRQSHAAEAVLREGLRQNLDHPELLLALGETLLVDRDDLGRAGVLWHRAIAVWEAQERAGDKPEPFLYRQLTARLAILEERRGELAAAADCLHKLRRFSPFIAAIDARLAELPARQRAPIAAVPPLPLSSPTANPVSQPNP